VICEFGSKQLLRVEMKGDKAILIDLNVSDLRLELDRNAFEHGLMTGLIKKVKTNGKPRNKVEELRQKGYRL
jgi:hypothetical protein